MTPIAEPIIIPKPLQLHAKALDLGEHFGVHLLRTIQVLGGQRDDREQVGLRPLGLGARERIAEPLNVLVAGANRCWRPSGAMSRDALAERHA